MGDDAEGRGEVAGEVGGTDGETIELGAVEGGAVVAHADFLREDGGEGVAECGFVRREGRCDLGDEGQNLIDTEHMGP